MKFRFECSFSPFPITYTQTFCDNHQLFRAIQLGGQLVQIEIHERKTVALTCTVRISALLQTKLGLQGLLREETTCNVNLPPVQPLSHIDEPVAARLTFVELNNSFVRPDWFQVFHSVFAAPTFVVCPEGYFLSLRESHRSVHAGRKELRVREVRIEGIGPGCHKGKHYTEKTIINHVQILTNVIPNPS